MILILFYHYILLLELYDEIVYVVLYYFIDVLEKIIGVSDVVKSIKDNIKRITIQLEDLQYVFNYLKIFICHIRFVVRINYHY